VICCLENEGRAEAGRLLGLKEGTVSSRLDHARKLLRLRLAGRGISLSSVLAATTLAHPAGATVPPALLTGTARAAALLACGRAPAVSARVTGLVATPTWWKITAALTLTLSVLAGWAGLVARHPAADSQPGGDGVRRPEAAARTDRHGDPLPPGVLARL